MKMTDEEMKMKIRRIVADGHSGEDVALSESADFRISRICEDFVAIVAAATIDRRMLINEGVSKQKIEELSHLATNIGEAMYRETAEAESIAEGLVGLKAMGLDDATLNRIFEESMNVLAALRRGERVPTVIPIAVKMNVNNKPPHDGN